MKKKMMLRGMAGIPIGITIGYLITVLISLGWGNGEYLPCVPELTVAVGNEIRAVILQTVLCGVVGAGFAAGSLIWEIEQWGLVKQTGIYFLLISGIMLPIAYFAHWMEHSLKGFLSYFGIFVLIFVVTWLVQFVIGRHTVRKMNAGLDKAKDRQKINDR